MKTRTRERTRDAHPTERHLYRLGASNVYVADLTAVLAELALETPEDRDRREAREVARRQARRAELDPARTRTRRAKAS